MTGAILTMVPTMVKRLRGGALESCPVVVFNLAEILFCYSYFFCSNTSIFDDFWYGWFLCLVQFNICANDMANILSLKTIIYELKILFPFRCNLKNLNIKYQLNPKSTKNRHIRTKNNHKDGPWKMYIVVSFDGYCIIAGSCHLIILTK